MSQYKQLELSELSLESLVLEHTDIVCPHCEKWGDTIDESFCDVVRCPYCKRPTHPPKMTIVDGQMRLRLHQEQQRRKLRTGT